MPSIETLPYLLKQLRLPAIANHWQEHTQLAEKNHASYGEYLASLLELELVFREQKRLGRAYRNSKLPVGKTMATFAFQQAKSVNQAQIQGLAEDCTWVEEAQNLILLGPSGVGKTHLAAAIAYGLLEQGISVYFSSTTLLVQTLQQAKKDLKLKQALDRLAKFKLLILDDIGYVKKTEQETSVLFELIAHRYEYGSLLITANQPFGDWDTLFPDKIMAVAAIDRIVHHATIIKVEGESYRVSVANQRNNNLTTGDQSN
jgi:DNA replication protein DnaC